jgi:hypothetical protein
MTSDGSAGGLPADRLAARVMAHTLIEQTQVAPRPELVERLTEEARRRGWGEVLVVLLHCRLLADSRQGLPYATIRAGSDAMLAVAEATAADAKLYLAKDAGRGRAVA